MTPNEKAIELVEKYLRIEDDTVFYWEAANDRRYFDDEVFNHAKKCAKIAVDEIIKLDDFSIEGRDFWSKVRDCLNKF